MKIVTWNCNGALRRKFENLKDFQADIMVIQECEDPITSEHKEFQMWASNHLWIGDNKHKGLGIFAKPDISIQLASLSNTYEDHEVKYFLPCVINNAFQLIGIWAHRNNSPNFGYIGQIWKYLQVNKKHFNNSILIGDFNSNSIWDEWDRWWNHSDVVRELKELGFESLYHQYFNEKQGQESQPTFLMQRNITKPYHIDYIFGSREFSNSLKCLGIGDKEKWLEISDHLPVYCELDIA